MADFFSTQSSIYAKNRPTYPDELFLLLKNLCHEHQLAWDVATGNGQCAISLSDFFTNVYATDLSEEQISNSFKRQNIQYKVEHAEKSSLKNESAVHYFHFCIKNTIRAWRLKASQ